ncbi:MAG: BrnA antitoxin family protein [Crocosphaera sp.]
METEYDFSKGKRGAIDPISSNKTPITLHLDNDILDWFRQQVHLIGGGNYQTLINEALRQHIKQQNESLEETFRRVLREELNL